MDTRERQFKMWSDLILSYTRSQQMYSITLNELYESTLCNNQTIKRRVSMDSLKQICDWMQANNFAEYSSDSRDKIFIFWRSI